MSLGWQNIRNLLGNLRERFVGPRDTSGSIQSAHVNIGDGIPGLTGRIQPNVGDIGMNLQSRTYGGTIYAPGPAGRYLEMQQAARQRVESTFNSVDRSPLSYEDTHGIIPLTPLMWDELIETHEFYRFSEDFMLELERILNEKKTNRPNLTVHVELPPALIKPSASSSNNTPDFQGRLPTHTSSADRSGQIRVRLRAFCFVEDMTVMKEGEFCLPIALPAKYKQLVQSGQKAIKVEFGETLYKFTFDIKQYKPGCYACRLTHKEI